MSNLHAADRMHASSANRPRRGTIWLLAGAASFVIAVALAFSWSGLFSSAEEARTTPAPYDEPPPNETKVAAPPAREASARKKPAKGTRQKSVHVAPGAKSLWE